MKNRFMFIKTNVDIPSNCIQSIFYQKTICYSANAGLKQNFMNKQQDFGHHMLLYIMKELNEGNPTPYGPTVATKNH